IYYKNKIMDDDQIIDSEEQMEIDHDIEHYVANLLKKDCCQKECLKNNLNINDVKIRYKCFLNLKKTEQDIYLKGVLSASLRNETTIRGGNWEVFIFLGGLRFVRLHSWVSMV